MIYREINEGINIARSLTCIRCPLGCPLEIELNGSDLISVSGNECPLGANYAMVECTAPTRMVTTTVRVTGANIHRLPVRTRGNIPKDKIMACIESLRGVSVRAPVNPGDVVLADVAGTGVDIIATRKILSV